MRLKPSILTSFVVLTVPVFFTIIAVTYLSNDRIARANAQELVERFRNEAIDNIQDDFNPIKSLVRSAAAIGDEFPELLRLGPLLQVFPYASWCTAPRSSASMSAWKTAASARPAASTRR